MTISNLAACPSPYPPWRTLGLAGDSAGYSYERLDGSVRGEERNLAIKNFSSKDVFVFMLSTKAGELSTAAT